MHEVPISINLGILKVIELFFFSFFGLIIQAFPTNNLEEAETDVQCSLTGGQETLGWFQLCLMLNVASLVSHIGVSVWSSLKRDNYIHFAY